MTNTPQSNGNASALRAANLTISFRTGLFGMVAGPKVLNDISLDFKRGAIVAVIGPNSVGKSTLFKTAMGFLAPEAGELEVLGLPAGSREAKRRTGYLPERDRFYPRMTVGENLEFVARLKGLASERAADEAGRLARRIGIHAYMNEKTGTLSKGILRRVGVAASLTANPELLLWDEPWDGMDPEGVRLLKRIALETRNRGGTIVIASHRLEELLELSDEYALLGHGRLLSSGTVAELRARGEKMRIETEADEITVGKTVEYLRGIVPDAPVTVTRMLPELDEYYRDFESP